MEMEEKIMFESKLLFMQHGIKTITMDDIAKHIGISKKTIYKYFPNKSTLLENIIQMLISNQENKVECAIKSSENAVEEFVTIAKVIQKRMAEISPNTLYDLHTYYPSAYQYLQKHRNECVNVSVMNNLEWGKQEGYYRQDFNTEIVTFIWSQQFEILFKEIPFTKTKYTTSEIQNEIFQLFIKGILTPKGLELFNKYLQNNE